MTFTILPPPMCVCGHGVAEHDLNRKNERTRCDTSTGPQATPCPCRLFTPAPS